MAWVQGCASALRGLEPNTPGPAPATVRNIMAWMCIQFHRRLRPWVRSVSQPAPVETNPMICMLHATAHCTERGQHPKLTRLDLQTPRTKDADTKYARACCEHFTLPPKPPSVNQRLPHSIKRTTVHVYTRKTLSFSSAVCKMHLAWQYRACQWSNSYFEAAACSIVRSSFSPLVAPNRTRLVAVHDIHIHVHTCTHTYISMYASTYVRIHPL